MKRKGWSKSEEASLRLMYATWSRKDIERALPRRTWHNIVAKAHKLGLKRTALRAFAAAMTRASAPVSDCPLAKVLRSERLSQRITARQLSARIGYGPGKVTAWETGRDTPGIQPLKEWAQSLGLRIAVVPA